MLELLILPISLLLVGMPYVILKKLNLKEEDRWKQLHFVYISVFFGIVTCLLFNTLNTLLYNLLRWNKLQGFLGQLIFPAIFEYGLALFVAILLNVGLLFVFCFVKWLSKTRVKKWELPDDWDELVKNNEPFLPLLRFRYWAFLNRIYSLDNRTFLLRKDLIKVKKTLEHFLKIMAFLLVALMFVLEAPLLNPAGWIPYDFLQKVYLLPAVSMIILYELLYYLGGKVEKVVEDGTSKKEHTEEDAFVDYSALEKEYTGIFKDRYITTFIPLTTKNNLHNEQSSEMLQPNPKNEEKKQHPIIEGIEKQLNADGFEINPDHMEHIEIILGGKDVIIDASIYSEFGEYLFRCLNVSLARGETVLVVCPDKQEMTELYTYMEERLERINSYHHIWEMDNYHDTLGENNRDILFTTLQIALDDNAFNDRFFKTLSTVVITNATKSMVCDTLLLSLLSFKLANLKKVQYICLVESIPLGIHQALTDALCLSEPVDRSAYHVYDKTKIMLWRYEDTTARAQDILENFKVPSYLGLALPFASLALKKGVDMVSIFSHSRTPLNQMLNNINANRHHLRQFFGNIQISFDEQVGVNHLNHKNKNDRFIVMDDELCNLPMALYNSAHFSGKNSTMIHIISKPYMLRDFFFDNAEKYRKSTSSIKMLMPCVPDTDKSDVFRILYEMQKNGLPEDEVIRRVKTLQAKNPSCNYADSSISIGAALTYCIEKATGKKMDGHVYHYFNFQKKWEFNGRDFDTYYLVKYRGNEEEINKISGIKLATLSIDGKKITTNFFEDCIYQRYLPGQYMVYDYRSHLIEDIRDGTMYLTTGRDDCEIPSYTQIRIYHVDNDPSEISDPEGRRCDGSLDKIVERYTVQHIKVPITVETSGYYVHEYTGEAFNCRNPFKIEGENKDKLKQARRVYLSANVLNLKIKFKNPSKTATSPSENVMSLPETATSPSENVMSQSENVMSQSETATSPSENVMSQSENAMIPLETAMSSSENVMSPSETDKIAFLMAVIMNEFVKTWFPYYKDCIAVCPVLKKSDDIYKDDLGRHISQLYPQVKLSKIPQDDEPTVELYIIEDSETNLGIVQSLMDNWQNRFENIFANLREYLDWQQTYNDSGNDKIHNKYLYFGKDSEPDCFEFKTLRQILNEISPSPRGDVDDTDRTARHIFIEFPEPGTELEEKEERKRKLEEKEERKRKLEEEEEQKRKLEEEEERKRKLEEEEERKLEEEEEQKRKLEEEEEQKRKLEEEEERKLEEEPPKPPFVKGEIIQFGKYMWRVLDVEGETALLLADEMTDLGIPYEKEFGDVSWEKSWIREWLNSEFLQRFSQEQQSKILSRKMEAEDNPWYHTPAGIPTEDKVFLLSIREVVHNFGDSGALDLRPKNSWKYGSSDGVPCAIYDEYNDARRATYKGQKTWWWLRSPGEVNSQAAYVNADGIILLNGALVGEDGGTSPAGVRPGVRPAIWIQQ